jgi:hypothetical protein
MNMKVENHYYSGIVLIYRASDPLEPEPFGTVRTHIFVRFQEPNPLGTF